MPEKRELRIGLVGCGGISHSHARGAALSDRARIVACADVIEERAEALENQRVALKRQVTAMRVQRMVVLVLVAVAIFLYMKMLSGVIS